MLYIILQNIFYYFSQLTIGIFITPFVLLIVACVYLWKTRSEKNGLKTLLIIVAIAVLTILTSYQYFWDVFKYLEYIFIGIDILLIGYLITQYFDAKTDEEFLSFLLLTISICTPIGLIWLKCSGIKLMKYKYIMQGLGIILPTLVVLSMQLIQKLQGDKIRKLENNRMQEDIDARTRQFFLENNEEIQYLPLCPVAFALNDSQIYNRKIINDFIIQPTSVQNEILKRKSLLWLSNIKTHGFDNTFDVMKQIVENTCKFSCDKLLMHNHGKYIKYCGIDYKKKELSAEYKRDYINYITTIFAEKDSPIGTRFRQILKEKDVDGFDQENKAQYLTMVSVGFFNQLIVDSDAWHDDKYQNVYSMVISDMKTNEDLFLYLILNLWTYKEIKNE